MKFARADLKACAEAEGLVVAIDVLRAFTTAACFFAEGVEEIILVSGVDEAFALRERFPGSLIAGEIDGIQVQGFDLGNSPAALTGLDLRGRRIILRTSAGTQGVVRAQKAGIILAAALTNATATIRHIQKLAPPEVTFILTGYFPEEGWGDEDAACADVFEALLTGQPFDRQEVTRRVLASRSGRHYDGAHPSFPLADLDIVLDFDRFDFAMQVFKENGLFLLRAVSQ